MLSKMLKCSLKKKQNSRQFLSHFHMIAAGEESENSPVVQASELGTKK
jgi:hypothetical protein